MANPPYVRSVDRDGLQPEVREEPALALYSGQDGLDAIGRLVEEAPGRLRDGGHLVFEFGFGQELDVERLIGAAASMQLTGLRRDLQGIARTAIVRKITRQRCAIVSSAESSKRNCQHRSCSKTKGFWRSTTSTLRRLRMCWCCRSSTSRP